MNIWFRKCKDEGAMILIKESSLCGRGLYEKTTNKYTNIARTKRGVLFIL